MKQPQLGQKIVELRRAKGLTQEVLAAACGINVRSLQRIESGDVMPRLFTLNSLSEQLDYSFSVETPSSRKAWWGFSKEADLADALKVGWISGVVYFVLSIPETFIVLQRYSQGLDVLGGIAFMIINIAVMVSAVLFFRGFIALGTKIEQSLIIIGAYLFIVLTVVFYSLDIISFWWGVEAELWLIPELLCVGFTGIFFGVGLSRAETELGNAAKVAAILEIVTGICFVLIVTSIVGLITLLPAIIAEIVLLYKAYQLFGEPDAGLSLSRT